VKQLGKHGLRHQHSTEELGQLVDSPIRMR
jgi:hypothetical protein